MLKATRGTGCRSKNYQELFETKFWNSSGVLNHNIPSISRNCKSKNKTMICLTLKTVVYSLWPYELCLDRANKISGFLQQWQWEKMCSTAPYIIIRIQYPGHFLFTVLEFRERRDKVRKTQQRLLVTLKHLPVLTILCCRLWNTNTASETVLRRSSRAVLW